MDIIREAMGLSFSERYCSYRCVCVSLPDQLVSMATRRLINCTAGTKFDYWLRYGCPLLIAIHVEKSWICTIFSGLVPSPSYIVKKNLRSGLSNHIGVKTGGWGNCPLTFCNLVGLCM